MGSNLWLGVGVATIAFVAGAVLRAEPLHDAARSGELERARELIAAGADVEALDEAVLSPLVLAALYGQAETVRLLIDAGAAPGGRDGNGYTALHAAAHGGHPAVVRLLLEFGLDVNDQANKARIAPLHAAAERDFTEIAALLLSEGADLQSKAGTGHTALAMAVLNGHEAMTALLRDSGADCSEIKLKRYRDFCLGAGS